MIYFSYIYIFYHELKLCLLSLKALESCSNALRLLMK